LEQRSRDRRNRADHRRQDRLGKSHASPLAIRCGGGLCPVASRRTVLRHSSFAPVRSWQFCSRAPGRALCPTLRRAQLRQADAVKRSAADRSEWV